MRNRIRVTINKIGHIPGVGNGPFKRPIWISRSVYQNLIKLGYPVVVVSDPIIDVKSLAKGLSKGDDEKSSSKSELITKDEKNKKEEIKQPEIQKMEEIIDNEDVIDEETIVSNEEIIQEEEKVENLEEDEEETEEVIINDKDLSANSYYKESFLTSKNICKKILNARQIQYDDNASKSTLIKLVLESNPILEEEEEIVEESV